MNKDKTFQEKLKNIFKKKESIVNVQPNREFILTNEILQDLGKDAPTNTRVKTMRDLVVHLPRLETNGVEKLWSCIQDMFLREYPPEVRHATFNFLQNIIRSQFDRIYVMRAQFFRFIKHHDNPQDIASRVDLLAALTNDGKEVEHFEEEIGPFLLNWITDVTRVGKLNEFLKILDNVIKFNSPHLDEYTMTGYVKHICVLCCNTNQFPIVILCLQILGTVVAYSILPPESLSQFVGTLCRTVNIKCYCPASWKTMKNLLGTHLGHSTLYTMCRFLQEPNLKKDAGLLKGCVFYVHMALWDINSMQNLCCPPSSVLPSVLQAVKCNHPSVAYEVILGIQKLINKQGLELLEPTWDIINEIILHIIKQIELAPNEVPNNLTVITLHEILNTIENLIEVGSYKGSMSQFFAVIHECSRDRPETSVLKLIKFQSKSIRPTESAWLQNLFNLLTNYFKSDIRTNIRLKVLNVLEGTIQLYGQYEDELINHIVIPHMLNIAADDNIVVRSEVAKLLVNLCKDYNSNICVELLEILEKLLLRPSEKDVSPNQQANEADFLDINVLVPGLIQVFARKIHKLPSNHAITIYKMFIDYLDKNLLKPAFKEFNQSRLMIFDCLLSIRADSNYRIGLPDPETKELKYSPYLCVSYKPIEPIIASPPTTSPTQTPVCKITYLPIESAFKLFLNYLEKERDWELLKLILDKLPEMLGNKAIILTKTGNPDVNVLVQVLCSMLMNKSFTVAEGGIVKVKRLDFQTAVVNVMVALSSYGNNLDLFHQQQLINTLTRNTGIDPRCSRQSINSLTICMVDMRETMMKLLPDVLLRLSKISATNYIAMPVLEFLSTLSQLPTVFANFVGDQYMAVFAIALPYTNPFKYDNYIVSLAYHVISVWFLKCRLPFRKDFVKFIVSGLQTNVMVPFQELNHFKLNLSSMNQDSSDRKRSSSLTEQGSRRRIKQDTTNKSTFIQKTPRDKTVLTFYEELNETCIDLMARYTYSPCSALPKRLPTAEFLLNGGISKSWMLGNKLITITTSGCTEKVLKHGVCDKCWSLCSSHNNSKIARYARSNSGNEEKDSFLARQSSTDKTEEVKKYDSASLSKLIGDEKKEPPICACWCQGWAEVLIRRPTGNVSWVMKVQNQVSFKQHVFEFPLNEMSTLYMPDLFFEPSSAISIEEQEETEDLDEAAGSSSSRPVSVPGPSSIQKSSSSSKLEKNRKSGDGQPTLAEKRDRLHTISVMSTSTRKPTPPKKVPKEILKSGLNPSFVFLQLYHTACFGSTSEVPLYVPPCTVIDRAINILDRMYPYEVHKIGVLYINEGQVDKEADILRNTSGCIRYMEFLQNLGTLVRLADVNPRDIYLGGVDQSGAGGKYMYIHQDDLVQLAFHVATLMPNKDSDPNGNYKKAHVGNDNVVIVYNNSGQEFDINTFRSQVTLAYIIVEPLDHACNKVEVKVKSDLLKIIGSNEVITVSDQSVSVLVRQLAIHADLAATVLNSLRSHATDPYASNWLERLRKLKNLREKVIQELKKRKDSQKGFSEEKDVVEDFTDFT